MNEVKKIMSRKRNVFKCTRGIEKRRETDQHLMVSL